MGLKEFEDLLLHFEEPVVSRDIIDQVEKLASDEQWLAIFQALFTAHLNRRLFQKVSPENIMNLHRSLNLSPKFRDMLYDFNHIITRQFLHKTEAKKYFFYLVVRDDNFNPTLRTSILHTALTQLVRYNYDDMMSLLDELSYYIKTDRIELLVTMMGFLVDGSYLKNNIIMEKSSIEERYQIILLALQKDMMMFCDLAIQLHDRELHSMIQKSIYRNGDSDPLMKALSKTTIPLLNLEHCQYLNDLIIQLRTIIPETVEAIFNKAVKEEAYFYLVNFAILFSKRRVLGAISKAPNEYVMEAFFSRYGSDPEIQHLKAFI